jgi:hypothetical protein
MQITWAKEADMNIILYSGDIGLFRQNVSRSMDAIKTALKDKTTGKAENEVI